MSPAREWIWLDGRILPSARARLPVLDRAVQYGYGLFEVTRAYGGVPFRLDRHLARMRRSAHHFRLAVPVQDHEVERATRRLLLRNRRPEAAVRLVLTAGGEDTAPHFMIRTRPRRSIPHEWYTQGARVRLSEWRRDPRGPLHGHKTLNYLEPILGHERAWEEGYADTILLGLSGELLEGCVSNVFLVNDNALHTPALGPILPGVTREAVLEIAHDLDIRVVERRLMEQDFKTADEAFITNALIELLPIVRAGTQRIGSGKAGPITRILMERYRQLVLKEAERKRFG